MPLTHWVPCGAFQVLMKTPKNLLLSGVALGLASCGAIKNVQQPLSDNGSFDPLSGPGNQSSSSSRSSNLNASSGVSFTPGQWIETSMPNSAFFKVIPKGDATADKVLQVGAPLKYISTQGSYVKVELDSGDVGYVPEIMVTDRAAAASLPNIPPPIVPDAPPIPDEDGFVPVAPGEIPGATLPVPSPSSTVPGTPSVESTLPEVPSTPAVPEVPATPDVPKVDVPSIPEVPKTDTLPVPKTPDVPAPPKVDGVTD